MARKVILWLCGLMDGLFSIFALMFFLGYFHVMDNWVFQAAERERGITAPQSVPTAAKTLRPPRADNPSNATHGTAMSCLTVQNVDSSLLERDELYMRLSWQADVANSCATPFDIRVVFKIFDKDDFELDWAMEYISVPANDIGKARGILFGETGTISRFAKQSATLSIP